jgi:hypothetical protein
MEKVIFKLDDGSEIAITENHIISFAYDANTGKSIIAFTGYENGLSSSRSENKEAYDKFIRETEGE